MTNSEMDPEIRELYKELKKLRIESKLQKSLSSELERQKSVAVEAKDLAIKK